MTSVFTNNRSQAVRLPADVRLPEGMKKLQVRARGVDRIISPAGHTWDEFFLNGPKASHDCLVELDAIKRRPLEVIGVFNENAGRMAITAITLSELFHGAEKSAKLAQNLAVVEEFASPLEVLPYTAKASQHCGAIRSALGKAGRPIV